MKPVVLFDLDGTLIDSTEAILESFGVAFSRFKKVTPKEELIKAQIGHTLEDMFMALGVDKEIVNDYVDSYKEHYRRVSCEKTILLPFAKDAIREAHEFATLGVVTTKTGRFSRELLDSMGIMHYFDVLVGREDVINPKPHPEPILKALSKLSHDKNHSWMIGDTCMDIRSANASGVNAIGVTSGYSSVEFLLQCESHLFDDAQKAVNFIKQQY
jgi:phosphoglycolate phosphatase